MQLLGNGQGDGAAHAAAHNTDLFQALGLGGAAQGPTKSWTLSPAFRLFSSMVVPPTIWK